MIDTKDLRRVQTPAEEAKTNTLRQLKRIREYFRYCRENYAQPDLTPSEMELIIEALANYEAMVLIGFNEMRRNE